MSFLSGMWYCHEYSFLEDKYIPSNRYDFKSKLIHNVVKKSENSIIRLHHFWIQLNYKQIYYRKQQTVSCMTLPHSFTNQQFMSLGTRKTIILNLLNSHPTFAFLQTLESWLNKSATGSVQLRHLIVSGTFLTFLYYNPLFSGIK